MSVVGVEPVRLKNDTIFRRVEQTALRFSFFNKWQENISFASSVESEARPRSQIVG
jgi:hypothetical protein